MKAVIQKSLSSRFDLLEIADFLEQVADLRTAERFLLAARKTMADLARMPGLGSPCEFRSLHLRDIRVRPIRGFRKHLIFYRPIRGGVEIVRVLHGARDVKALLLEADEL